MIQTPLKTLIFLKLRVPTLAFGPIMHRPGVWGQMVTELWPSGPKISFPIGNTLKIVCLKNYGHIKIKAGIWNYEVISLYSQRHSFWNRFHNIKILNFLAGGPIHLAPLSHAKMLCGSPLLWSSNRKQLLVMGQWTDLLLQLATDWSEQNLLLHWLKVKVMLLIWYGMLPKTLLS